MLEQLLNADLYLLQLLNVDLATPGSDLFWLSITNIHKQLWFKLGLGPALLLLLFTIYRVESMKVLVSLAITVGLSDTIAYRIFKSNIDRERPFQNQELTWVRKVGQAHGNSFPSNHATNVFAGATLLAWYFPSLTYFLYIFAFFVAISRVALGVHFPSDILVGAMLGIFVALLVRILLLERFHWWRLRANVSTSDHES